MEQQYGAVSDGRIFADYDLNAVIRRATSTGRPLGGEGFIKKFERRIIIFPKERWAAKGKRNK